MLLLKHDVLELDITMNNVPLVKALHCSDELTDNDTRLQLREWSSFIDIPSGTKFQHDRNVIIPILVHFKRTNDTRMVKSAMQAILQPLYIL